MNSAVLFVVLGLLSFPLPFVGFGAAVVYAVRKQSDNAIGMAICGVAGVLVNLTLL